MVGTTTIRYTITVSLLNVISTTNYLIYVYIFICYRTVRTIVHNMAKIKGNGILQHSNKIPQHSELHALLIRVLKNIQKDTTTPSTTSVSRNNKPALTTPQSPSSTKHLSNQVHEAMSNILSLISNRETGKEGIAKLYEFKVISI